MVCPLCGKKSEVGMFCSECYLKRNLKLEVPSLIELEHCPRCDAYMLKRKWVKGLTEERAVKNAVDNSLKTNIKGFEKTGALSMEVAPGTKEHVVTIRVTLGDAEVNAKSIVRIKSSVCNECSRIAGGYFEAVLQLRGGVSKKTLDEITKDVESHKDRYAFVSEIRKIPGGYDIYLGSKKSAEKIVKQFRGEAEIKKSFKQAGMDKQSGKPRSRFYYLIRL